MDWPLQLQGQCEQLKESLDEMNDDNGKQKQLVERLTAECNKLKQVSV